MFNLLSAAHFWQFFCLLSALLLSQACTSEQANSNTLTQSDNNHCSLDHADARIAVKHIYDGDTVKLSDGRKLRLIGINTPEIGRNGEASQPFARQAQQRLTDLLSHEKALLLRYDRNKQDHYKRTLAHAFLPNGRSISQTLLSEGLATSLTIPPNTWQADCYHQAERAARSTRQGIWSHQQYQAMTVGQLNASANNSYRVIHGQVVDSWSTSKAHYFRLQSQGRKASTGSLRVKITAQDRASFPSGFLEHIKHKQVEVRGWLHYNQQQFFMRLHHSNNLQIIEP